jgi:hypothetical protein
MGNPSFEVLMKNPLLSVHRPRNRGNLADERHAVIAPTRLVEGPYAVSVRAEQITARECRAIAAWLIAAAEWIEHGQEAS